MRYGMRVASAFQAIRSVTACRSAHRLIQYGAHSFDVAQHGYLRLLLGRTMMQVKNALPEF
jgi:hypothetical protein